MHPNQSKKILLIKYRALGDAIMTIGSCQYVKELYPNHEIHYAVPNWVAPLFDKLKGPFHKIIPVNLNTIQGTFDFCTHLLNENYELIHEFHQNGRTRKIFSTYSLLLNTKYSFHNHHLKSGGPVPDQGKPKALIQRDLDGIYGNFGKYKNTSMPDYLKYGPKLATSLNQDDLGLSDTIIFGIVATRETKMWPLTHFAQLAQLIWNHKPNFKIVVPISNSIIDRNLAETLGNLTKNYPSNQKDRLQILKVPLSELPSHIAKAKLYIGNDTGLKHLSAALGVKTLTLFGPEPPLEWHPYDQTLHPYFYREGLECRTRTAHYCGLSKCDSMICLNEITPNQIFSGIKKFF